MNNKKRRKVAESTLNIIETGMFEGICIKEQIQNNIDKTFLISPDKFNEYLEIDLTPKVENQQIEVINSSTIQAIVENRMYGKIGVLNFASANNPGGGFLGGASAQEESLARSSSLYASLRNQMEMYEFNRKWGKFIYSNYSIYSPDTLFWFDDEGESLNEKIKVDVVTCPAPNKGAMIQHNREDELEQINHVFRKRIEFVFKIAYQNKIDVLILGAWGCGVFKNEVHEVAQYFKKIIDEKVVNCFSKIVFAVYDSSEERDKYNTFKKIIDK